MDDRILTQRGAVYKAKSGLVETHPFLGSVLLKLPLEIVTADSHPDIMTAAVDRRGWCYFNLEFSEKLTLPQKRAVLLHEALHLALQVFQRQGERDMRRWNIAHDYAINLMIDHEIRQASGCGMAWPDHDGFRPLLDSNYAGMSAEEIYERVAADHLQGYPCPGKPNNVRHQQKGFPDATDVIDPKDDPRGDGGVDGQGGAGHRDHPGLGDYWKEVLASAYEYAVRQEAAGMGHLPGWAKSLVEDVLTPAVPWGTKLAHMVHGRLHGKRRTFAKVGRRSHACGVNMPGNMKHRGCVGIFMDVSGSISPSVMTAFATEIFGILAQLFVHVRVITWDTHVHDDFYWEDAESFLEAVVTGQFQVEGRGGTDVQCVIDHLIDDANPDMPMPNIGIILTDGHVPWVPARAWPIDPLVVYTQKKPDMDYGYDAIHLASA